MKVPFVDTITIDDFKDFFIKRKAFTFNEFPKYDPSATYQKNDKVYKDKYFDVYNSQADSNTNNTLSNTAFWLQDNSFSSLVFDEFITQSFEEAYEAFHSEIKKLPHTDITKRNAYLFLTAHFLMLLLQERQGLDNGSAITSAGMVASESGDGYSVSFTRPTNLSLFDDFYLQTPYGKKYWEIAKSYNRLIITIQPKNKYSTSGSEFTF